MTMTEALSLAIKKWEAGRESRNLTMLKRLTHVSYSTIRRIVQNETSVLPETAMRIAERIMSQAELHAFVQTYMPTFAKTRTEVSERTEDEDMMEYLENRDYVPVLLLASHRAGTNEAEVRDFFGREAARRFSELVSGGHLAPASGGNFRLDRTLGGVSLDTARQWISVMASICPSENDNIERSSLAHVAWESVNFETALAVYHAAIDFVRQTMTLVRDERNKGDVLIMIGTLFNVLKGTEEYP